MKKVVKISRLSVVCVLCAAGFSSAYGASSVRSLGGVGTYNSAASAGSAAINSARAGSIRATTGTAGKAVNTTGSTGAVRAGSANTSRLSVGSYLQGGKTISGGSSIKSQNPGTSSSITNNNNNNTILQEQIETIQRTIDGLQESDAKKYTIDETDDLLDEKQDVLIQGDGISIVDGVISAVVVDGKQVLLQSDGEYIQWKYDDDASTWEDLVALVDLQGPQGEKGDKGDKGEQGEAGDLSDYSTSTQVIGLILQAIETASSDYATAAQGTKADTALQPSDLLPYSTTEQIANNYYSKTEIATEIADAIDDVVAGDVAGKADKVDGATNGNLAGLDASGNLTDSGVAKTTIDTMGNNITTLQTDVTNLGDAVTEIEGDITTLQTTVTNHGDAITEIEGDITTLQTSVTNHGDAITEIQGDIVTVQGNITNINESVTTLQEAIEGKPDTTTLGKLAVKDTVATGDIDIKSVTREKLEQPVQASLALADSALQKGNVSSDGEWVLAMKDGAQVWLEVVE